MAHSRAASLPPTYTTNRDTTPLFPVIEVEGRLLSDPALVNNVPIDRVLQHGSTGSRLCIAVDLYGVTQHVPMDLDQTAARMQDIAFSSQTRRSIAALLREHENLGSNSSAILAHLEYNAPPDSGSLKSLDFSASSIEQRRQKGFNDMQSMMRRLTEASLDGRFLHLTSAP